MSQREFITRIIAILEQTGIPYMITGSFGSSFHGEPRATNDIDIVIAPTFEQLKKFSQSFGSEYYISELAVLDAWERQSMFNIIDHKSGWKADVIIRKNRPYSKEEFQRRRKYNVNGSNLFFVSPEDAILSKLEWAKESGSEQQFRDALGVAIIQRKNLDIDYLRKWSKELGISELFESLLEQADKFQI